ncbi:MAG: peptidoglycan-binding domain-containing protein [Patescibacteria group bacterium]
MKTINTEGKIMKKFLYSLAMVQATSMLLFPIGIALAAAPAYVVNLDNQSVSGLTLSIDGTATATKFAGQADDQHVGVDWGDGSTVPDENTNFTFDVSGDDITNGQWNASHVYASSGSYNVTIKFYHGNWQGAESSGPAVVTIQVNIPPVSSTGSLTVTKIVNGGTAATSSFSLFVDGSPVTSGIATTTNAGVHVVTEATTTDYVASFSGACDSQGNVTVSTSTPANCILTNTFTGGVSTTTATSTITVVKIVNGGTATTSDFHLFLDGNAVTSGVATTTNVGSHVVSEATTTDYVGVFSGDCNSQGVVNLTASSSATCTITNTFSTSTATTSGATINIRKVTNPGNIDQDFHFTLTKGESFTATTTANAQTGTSSITGLKPGVYTLTEEQIPYWSFGSVSCQYENQDTGSPVLYGETISINDEDVVDCTFTNNATAIKVIKNVVASDGSSEVSDTHSFSVTLNGTSTLPVAEGSDALYINLAPGSYVIAENSDSNYDLVSIAPTSTVSVVAGTTTVVTITNKQHAAPQPAPSGGGGGNTNTNSGGPTGYSSSPISSGAGEVLGASTDTGSSCGLLLTSYLRFGRTNSTTQVIKLQTFLNQNLGIQLPVNGFFGPETDAAVRTFQVKYGEEVLGPWVRAGLHPSITIPTGYVYKTTLRWINILNCPASAIPVPQLP